MPSWLKIMLIVGASGALLLALAIGCFAWWIHANRAELREKAEAPGKQFGLGKSSHACIDESFTRLERTSDVMQRARLGIFLRSCLRSAPRDPELCVGVPATGEILRSDTWRNGICAAHGKPGDQACAHLVGMIQEVCDATP